jgi:regulator of replication initiation timing
MVNTLKLEDRLEGETNFQDWKARVFLLLEENDLKEYVEEVVPSPTHAVDLEFHKKREVKAKQVLVEFVKDHLIPHISKKTYSKEIYDALVGLYRNGNIGMKLHLKHQLQVVRMSSEETVVNYIMRITQIQDKLVAIGDKVEDIELVNVAFRGLPNYWEPFVKGICA